MNTGICKEPQRCPGSGTTSGRDYTCSLSTPPTHAPTRARAYRHAPSAVSVALHCRLLASLIQILAPAKAREAARQLQLEKQNSLYSQVILESDVMKSASLFALDLSDPLDS